MKEQTKAKVREVAKEAAKAGVSWISWDTAQRVIDSETGKEIQKNLKVGILGLGPKDEAIYRSVKNFLEPPELEKIIEFEEKLIQEKYSLWWFRNVVATQHQNYKDESKSNAVLTLKQIAVQSDFDNQKKVAGQNLMKKSLLGYADENWDMVKDNGKLWIIAPSKKAFQSVWGFTQNQTRGFREGFAQSVRSTWGGKIFVVTLGGLGLFAILGVAWSLFIG